MNNVVLMVVPESVDVPLNVVVPAPAVNDPFMARLPVRIKFEAGTRVAPAFTVTLVKLVVLIVVPDNVLTPPLKTTVPTPGVNEPSLEKFERILSVVGAVSEPDPLIVSALKLVVLIWVPLMMQAPAMMSVPLLCV